MRIKMEGGAMFSDKNKNDNFLEYYKLEVKFIFAVLKSIM
jgi:hypothetical protein